LGKARSAIAADRAVVSSPSATKPSILTGRSFDLNGAARINHHVEAIHIAKREAMPGDAPMASCWLAPPALAADFGTAPLDVRSM
jgi:hypothetical protein